MRLRTKHKVAGSTSGDGGGGRDTGRLGVYCVNGDGCEAGSKGAFAGGAFDSGRGGVSIVGVPSVGGIRWTAPIMNRRTTVDRFQGRVHWRIRRLHGLPRLGLIFSLICRGIGLTRRGFGLPRIRGRYRSGLGAASPATGSVTRQHPREQGWTVILGGLLIRGQFVPQDRITGRTEQWSFICSVLRLTGVGVATLE